MKKLNEKLSEVFDVEPIQVESNIVEVKEPIEDDADFARQNIRELIDKGNKAVDGILNVAKESEKARDYEVAANLIKSLSDLNKETKDKKWQRGLDFNKLLNDEHFNLFIESKTKLFSHSEEITKTISESLFGEKLSLKKIFHNRDESIRFVLWYYLFIMNLMIEISKKEKNEERIKKF
jgi:hypothetical protein